MKADLPEERLLRLIRGGHKKKNDIKQKAPRRAEAFLPEFIKKIFLKDKILKSPLLKSINKALVVILILSSAYFVYSLLFETQKDIISLIREKEVSPPSTDIEPKEEVALPKIEDYSVYAKEIKGKRLFSAPIEEPGKMDVPEVDISKKFNLVGIIAGAQPQAIIEDKELKKTHYLYEGQSFNGATVEEIGSGRVVLNYRGKKIILVL